MDNRVFLLQVDSYNPDLLYYAMQFVEQQIGLQKILGEKSVLLKPNLLVSAAAERAVCTHPEVIRALARVLNRKHVQLGDSPAFGSTESVAKAAGIYAVCQDENLEIVDFNNPIPAETPKNAKVNSIQLASAVVNAGAVINCAKLKTHALTRYTGAVKNLYGCLPGKLKAQMHLRMDKTEAFSDYLLDIYLTVNPVLSLVDGIVAMEGNGPRNGTPRKIGVLIAGCDGVAVDTVACSVVGIDPLSVPTIRAARSRGIGFSNIEEIEVIGAKISDVQVLDFRTIHGSDNTLKNMPPFLKSLLRQQLTAHPFVSPGSCINCGVCLEACPADAVTLKDFAVIDDQQCIRCYCCQELCPEGAVSLRRRGLGRLFKA